MKKTTRTLFLFSLFITVFVFSVNCLGAEPYFNGSGTEADPYCIASYEDLCNFAKAIDEDPETYASAYYLQTAHIQANKGSFGFDEETTTPLWNEKPISDTNMPIKWAHSYTANFSGTYDGNYYVIEGIYNNVSENGYPGIFNVCTNATIKNLHIKNSLFCAITADRQLDEGFNASICGDIYNSVIENCDSNAYVIGGSYTGGICGAAVNSSIVDCYFEGTAISTQSAGGICGFPTARTSQGSSSEKEKIMTIDHCQNEGYIVGRFAGGICGNFFVQDIGNTGKGSGILSNCVNYGAVASISNDYPSDYAVGGISGTLVESPITVIDCCNYGAIGVENAADHTGGIIGNANTTDEKAINISYCFNAGKISGRENIGGIIGNAEKNDVAYCYNIGNVTGTKNIGSIGGNLRKNTVTDCFYLNGTGSAVGTESSSTVQAQSKTKAEMQTEAFVNLLNAKEVHYKFDGLNENMGYPMLCSLSILPFKDVIDESQYYFEPVVWAYYNDITKGTSPVEFTPNGSCTRGQVVTFLWRFFGCPEPETKNSPFADISSTDYFYNAVLWAYEYGITVGTSDTTFSPNNTVTRAEFVTFLWRCEDEPESSATKPFKDIIAGQYYEKAVAWAAENSITAGISPSEFAPNNSCTRGQVVTFLFRYEDYLAKTQQ